MTRLPDSPFLNAPKGPEVARSSHRQPAEGAPQAGELAERLARVGALAHGVAHEINNPLSFVLANLEYALDELRREQRGSSVVTALEEAQQGAVRVRDIVRALHALPRGAAAARERLDAPAREAASRADEPARVLVVDDDRMVCRALERILSPPHHVHAVQNGRAAIALLDADADYELVICDLKMQGLSGMDVHRLVAARNPALADRFVFVTGGGGDAAVQEFLDRVPNERMEKPFEPAALRERVSRLLARRRLTANGQRA